MNEIRTVFSIGYNKASRIIENLEALGIVTAQDHVGQREVVATAMPAELDIVAAVQKTGKTPKKETDADRAVRDRVNSVTARELCSFVERIERLDAEKKDLGDAQKEVFAEAKGRGYNAKVMRLLIALRKRDANEVAEEDAILELYKEVLGM